MPGATAPARNRPEVRSNKADSEEDGYEAKNAIDGDPDTLWHTSWTDGAVPHSYALTIEFKEPMALRGVAVLPRQDHNRNGWIKDYECYISADGISWGAPATKGTFSADAKLKTVSFERPVTARFVRFIALTGFDDDPFTSIAEFSLLAP
jgi:beta-galactosidase